jgi:archaellum component FlaC
MATLEETVTREEYDTLLKGLATKGDIKIVVDRIQALEDGLGDLKSDVAGLKSGIDGLEGDIEELAAAVVRIMRHMGIK